MLLAQSEVCRVTATFYAAHVHDAMVMEGHKVDPGKMAFRLLDVVYVGT